MVHVLDPRCGNLRRIALRLCADGRRGGRGDGVRSASNFSRSHSLPHNYQTEQSSRCRYQFKYHVEFKNNGVDTVQMLSRHWIFGDAEGRTNEVKGPGAVGKTPVLRPGESWSYDSGTRIRTPTGSMAGSFQFAVLEDVSGSGFKSFNARVSRLSLTEERRPVRVPCVDEASVGQLPPTSVRLFAIRCSSVVAPPTAALSTI